MSVINGLSVKENRPKGEGIVSRVLSSYVIPVLGYSKIVPRTLLDLCKRNRSLLSLYYVRCIH